MSIAIHHFPLQDIQQLSLAEFISTEQSEQCLPCFVSFEQECWQVDESLRTTKGIQGRLDERKQQQTSLELVVFSDISLNMLCELLTHCQLSIQALNAINARNNLISYRFKVSSEQLTTARESLVNFTLSNRIEAALIDNAPKLSQPGVLVMDMDSTTIKIECIDEIYEVLKACIQMGFGTQQHDVLEMSVINVGVHSEKSFEYHFDDVHKVFGERYTKRTREYFFIIKLVFYPCHQKVDVFSRTYFQWSFYIMTISP